MKLNALSDIELWALIACDNYRAFIVLFDRYWARLYKTSQKYIGDTNICEEIVHDLFLTLWNKRKELEIKNFKNYLTAATRYSIYARLQKEKHQRVIFMQPEEMENSVYELNKGLDSIIYTELEHQVDEQLQALPARCREIFLLSRKENLSNTEIADKLKISKRTVENQITVALKHLRKYLSDAKEKTAGDTYTLNQEKLRGVIRNLNATLKQWLFF